jgi:outer membrane receptor protein involved in Fe transport
VGSLTFGWFHKKITDYIVANLESGNYSHTAQHGIGAAPAPGGTPILGRAPGPGTPAVYFGHRDIANFIPWVYNASLSWRYKKFNTTLLYNVTGENPTTISVLNPALNQYRYTMKTLNASVGYQYKPTLGFTLNASNILNEPQVWYIGYKDRMRRTTINFVTMTFGVNGRF